MVDIKDLETLISDKYVFLFQYQKIKPDTVRGLETFISKANENFQKVKNPLRFEIFIDQIFNEEDEVIGERVYLHMIDDISIFKKLENKTIQNMVFEYLFHMLGQYANDWETEDE